MPFWNQKRVEDFVVGLGKGVQGASIEEFLGFTLVVILVVWLLFRLQRKSDARRRESAELRSRKLFEKEMEERALPPSAVELLEDLAYEMKVSGKEDQIHRLFLDSSVYDHYALILLQEDPDLQRPLRLLKPILGLGHGISGQMASSTEEIPADQEVRVQFQKESFYGVVVENDGHSLRIQLKDRPGSALPAGAGRPGTGQPVEIHWQRKGVHYSTRSRVKDDHAGLLSLEHAGTVQATHRRKYVRARCDLKGQLAGETIRITNIGGGGFFTPSSVSSLSRAFLPDAQDTSHPPPDALTTDGISSESAPTATSSRTPESPEESTDGPNTAALESDIVLKCRILLPGQPAIECMVSPVGLYEGSSRNGYHLQFKRIRPGDQDRIVNFVLKSEQG